MKLFTFLPTNPQTILWIVILSCLVPVGILGADDTVTEYTPEEFGISLGMSEQAMLTSLVNQGFSFKAGGKYKKIGGSRVLDMMFDYILSVEEDNGAVDIWSSANVILGVKNGALTLVEEYYEFTTKEAEQTFEEMTELFDDELIRVTNTKSNKSIWTNKQRRLDDQWQSIHWLSLQGDSRFKEENSRQRVWRDGSRYVAMSLRHAKTKVGRKIRSKKVILLMHADWCAYPMFEDMHPNNEFDCPSS